MDGEGRKLAFDTEDPWLSHGVRGFAFADIQRVGLCWHSSRVDRCVQEDALMFFMSDASKSGRFLHEENGPASLLFVAPGPALEPSAEEAVPVEEVD